MALSNVVNCNNVSAINGKSTYGFAVVAWVTDATDGYATVHVAAYIGATLSNPFYYYSANWGKAYINDVEKSSTTFQPKKASDWNTNNSFSWGGVSFGKACCVASEATERIYYGYGVTGSAKVSMSYYSSGSDGYNPTKGTHSTEAWVSLPYQAPPVTTPTLSNPSISSRTTNSAYSEFTVTNDGGASIQDYYQDLSLTNFGTVIQTIGRTGTFSSLSPGTTYYVRANASNGTYRGYSGVTSFTTVYAAPTNVSINPVATSKTAINLNRNWSNATYCQYQINDWGWIAEGSSYSNGVTVNGNNVTGLTANTTYTCQIRMGNHDSDLTYSNVATATTWSDPPTNLSISNKSSYWKNTTSGICIGGTLNATSDSAITNYTVYYKRSIDSTYSSINNGTSTTFEIPNLQESTSYDIYFTATNNGGTATLATSVSQTTITIHNVKVAVNGNSFVPLAMYVNVSNGNWVVGEFKISS